MKKNASLVSAVCLAVGIAGWASSVSAQCAGYAITQTTDGVIATGGDDTGNHGDDVVTSGISLPFTFNFFGTDYTSINVSSNGNAQFTTSFTTYLNTDLPTGAFNGPVLLPLWDDLRTDGVGEGVFTSTTGTAPNRVFHVVWIAHYFAGFAGQANFEIRLAEGSNAFDFIYGGVASGGQTATIGCQAGDASSPFSRFSFDPPSPGPIVSGTRVHFAPSNGTLPAILNAGVDLACGIQGNVFTITANLTFPGCPAQTFVSGSANCTSIGAGTVSLSGSGTGPFSGTGTIGGVTPDTYTIPVHVVLSNGTADATFSVQVVSGGDEAGDTIASANVITSSGPLTTISGVIGNTQCANGYSDADVYKIGICDPANFSATTVGTTTYDTQLFLFTGDGVGIVSDDDSPTGGGLQSTISNAFTSSLAPGNYYLAISGYNKDPLDNTGALIWLNAPFAVERAPDGPSATHTLHHWDTGGSTFNSGSYTITLTGACGVIAGCHGTCVADFDDGSGTGHPDDGVTIDDLLYYITIFEQGLICCDVDNGTGTGTQDGGVTIDDLLYFILRFTAGC